MELYDPIPKKKNLWFFLVTLIRTVRCGNDIQGDSGGICTTLGCDSMSDSKQKSSYEHGSDFERLRSYDRLKLGIKGNDYWQWTEENNKPAQYMIHLKYKFKVKFVKLPLIWIDLCLKLVFENVTAGRNTGCRSVVNCASCSLQFPLTHSDAVSWQK